MMYKRTDLTLSMFYASSADADGNKEAAAARGKGGSNP